jgi:hypothetical protein
MVDFSEYRGIVFLDLSVTANSIQLVTSHLQAETGDGSGGIGGGEA